MGCARGQNRTADTRIFSPLLYRLSYPGPLDCKPAHTTRLDFPCKVMAAFLAQPQALLDL